MYMGNENHFLVMEFRNNYIVPLIKEKERYISTKRDSGSHGIGLHTVKKLVERYRENIMCFVGCCDFTYIRVGTNRY